MLRFLSLVPFAFIKWQECGTATNFWDIKSGLQITVGHRTMADQNLPMSDEIVTLVGHFVRPIFCCKIWLYHFQIKFDFLIRYSFECTSVFMSDQIFLLSDQNGALVGHMSFQGKKIICSPVKLSQLLTAQFFIIFLRYRLNHST